ncbi:MAG: LysR family transcriptional regulator [Myxococcales bacterium]|nr:LysR family transcriptional regulator [Myxococcales bacterium]
MSNSGLRHPLTRLNLNLLPMLEALLRERNVTAAARRAGVSQSAMSHSLAKLRALLEDPLLVMSGRDMVLTPRGEQLARALPGALDALEATLARQVPFDPASSQQEFRIATFDYFELTTIPALLEHLRRHAPGIKLSVERLDRASPARLLAGELDLVLGGESMTMPPSLVTRRLYRDPFMVIVRPGHPALRRGRLPLNRYIDADHLLISVEGRALGPVDRALAKRGRARRVALRLPHFGSAGLAVMRSDLVCTLASSVAQVAQETYGVLVLPPPLPLPAPAITAWWPPQHDDDPPRRWLRQALFGGEAMSPRLRKLMR